MKSQNIFVYTILAIGILSIPSLLDTGQLKPIRQTKHAQNTQHKTRL